MKNFNRYLSILVVSLLSAFVFVSSAPVSVFAANVNDNLFPSSACDQAPNSPACQKKSKDPILGNDGLITKIANYIAWAAGSLAVIMIIFAAFRFVKSSGDSGKVTAARETIIYSIVGLIVIVLARIITGFVISLL